uniref:Retrotransposon protein, putative, unclassified n=1 Tax=Oryza sativa subsp. japonica TaxID=39947 RepID=Q2QRS5_ORYSJ|nr:retrotransposon protein, putative, unclassified [Oryza sativa Japonica Group]
MATPARFSTKAHIFDGTYFPHWCSKMQSYIMAEVSHPYVILEAINTDALKTEFENNCKARNMLLSGISRSDYDCVAHLETAHEIWNALKNFHQGTNNIKELRRDLFKKEYIKFEMKPGEALDDYLSRFNKILSDLRSLVANRIARAMNNARNWKRGGPNRCFECGSIDHLRSHCPKLGRGKREDKDGEKTNNNKPNNYKSKGSNQGRKMENLRKAFQQVCAAFEPLSDVDGESGDDGKGKNVSDVCFMARGESDTDYEDNEVSTFEEAINILSAKNKKCEKMYKKQEFIIESLKSEIDRLKSLIPNDDDCENYCLTCNLNKMKLKDALGRVEYMEDIVKNNEVLSCPKCRKGECVMVDCENCANLEKEVSYLKNSLLRFSDGKKNLNMILDQSKVLVLEVALVARKENVWIVDSGCSRHMTGNKNWFSSLKKASKTESIIFGDAATSAVLATGMVKLMKILRFTLRKLEVFDSCGDSVLNISRYGRVFKADFENPVSPVITCLVAKFDKDVMFWHRRLGHVSFDHLTRLSGLDLVRGLPKLKKDHDLVCTRCRHAKMVSTSHAPIVSVMTDAPGQLLHMDTVGPARVQSVGGKCCKCFVLKSGNLDKFEARSTDRLFLGYPAHTRGYRVLILGTNKIVETCEVSFDEASLGTRPDIAGTLSQVQGEDGRIFEDESDYDDDEVGSAGQTGRQAGQTAGTPPVRPAHDVRLDQPGSSGSGTVDADRDGPPEITTSTSTDTEHGSTSEVAAPLHIQRRHPPEQIIGNIGERTTRSKVTTHDVCTNSAFVASFEPKDESHALTDESWINAMHEELENFKRNKVWTLVEPPSGHNIIGTKWVFKNKKNEDGLIVRNKVRLVAQGFTQVEGLDFDETFAPIARIEAIRLLLAFAASKGFTMGKVDKTLFVLKHGDNQLFVQIYVDDIIFGCSTHALVVDFAETMRREFEMSMMGELSYFLGLQIKQTPQASPRVSHRQAVKRIMSAINIAKNPVQHSRTKHIDICFHFLRDHVEKGEFELQFLDTKLQIADIFTKPLDSNRFAFLRGELGIIHPFGMI